MEQNKEWRNFVVYSTFRHVFSFLYMTVNHNYGTTYLPNNILLVLSKRNHRFIFINLLGLRHGGIKIKPVVHLPKTNRIILVN